MIHNGVTNNMRMNKEVKAGRVVADVAVRCVERKSVSWMKGFKMALHREVKTFKVSSISSRLFWCLACPSGLEASFSPAQIVDDNGE